MIAATPSAMDDWVKRLSIGLMMAFILGALAVMANDSNQERRLGEVEAQANDHDEQIRILRESKVATELHISQIQKDIERIASSLERLSQ